MGLMDQLRWWLYEPSVRGLDVDDEKFLEVHAAILREKTLLRSAFETFYRDMGTLCDRFLASPGTEIELGTGAGFFKSMRPGLVTSDIRKGLNIDLVLDAQNMALPEASVRCIYAINVFHHLPDPDLFFAELCRVVRPGGGCILIEPHGGLGSALLHRYLHSDEIFDAAAPNWKTANIRGPLSGANQALAHIVFERDLNQFNARYGDRIEITYRGYCLNALRYLCSGGLNFRQLLPSASEPVLVGLESMGRSLARYWSLHQIIVMRRR
ncbi:MAG TPA: methyltransferase domain-containing protein [Pseudolabrys sp.]|nr:methyltransferase domain-containing protein [Pseudolabrys sp.]